MSDIKRLTDSALATWKQQITRLDEIIDAASDDDLQREIAPGRNRLYYLFGHLAAVHDRMLPLLGIGERMHANLDQPFLESPDSKQPVISTDELRRIWKDVNTTLTTGMEKFEPDAWLARHNSVSDEDFATNPLRHRFSVLLSRTAHAAWHLGQMRLAH